MSDTSPNKESLFPKKKGVFYDSQVLPKGSIQNKFVAWIDLMGAQAAMGRSISNAANYIGKIHAAALQSEVEFGLLNAQPVLLGEKKFLKVYPVVDGCYVLAEEKDDLEVFCRAMMWKIATTFIHSPNDKRFLVRGGISYGRVIEGKKIYSAETRC